MLEYLKIFSSVKLFNDLTLENVFTNKFKLVFGNMPNYVEKDIFVLFSFYYNVSLCNFFK